MRAVVRRFRAAYFTPMSVAISRLLTLVALVLMPFGMNAAMAAPPADHTSVAMAQHCGDRSDQSGDMAAKHAADCTVACSGLLAAETAVAEPALAVRLPPAWPHLEIVTGFHPDIATPPPKLS